MPKLRQKAIFVAIPSTSGTATEVTAFSVITDYKTLIKYPLADFEITPDIAILDSKIPLTMPKSLTADTGMDALTHAIEAYVAALRSPFSDALALKAIQMIYENILSSVDGSEEARGNMHIAQCMAGMAFSNALLGIAHSLAHKTGAQFDIPHGRCNAILLPYVIEYNARAVPERMADIARALGLAGATSHQLTNSLVEAIKELNKKLGIKQSYCENGVSEENFLKVADFIAENATADPCTGSNPVSYTHLDVYKRQDGIRAGELEGEFAELNGWEAESDASKLIQGLGLSEDILYQPMSSLPDNEKIKVLLAQALFGKPDIILLDEPTNHLDVASVHWLEDFLMEMCIRDRVVWAAT